LRSGFGEVGIEALSCALRDGGCGAKEACEAIGEMAVGCTGGSTRLAIEGEALARLVTFVVAGPREESMGLEKIIISLIGS
jgi:hypothetical protein